MPTHPKTSGGLLALLPLFVPLVGNALLVLLWSQLLFVPPGTSIRPMAAAALGLFLFAATLLIGLASALVLLLNRKFAIGLLCLFLSIMSVATGFWLPHVITHLRGLTWSE